eukprot:CAMPEP_0117027580 /NCGR_PEP_ID=MMETSP0472-20121206/20147_1 /TAXON_ID=693140 ORGANISM="Tiarina fusus, Strain LIS" /NCGR_SAMPLE_ID=MMETSP0472 /ASSEMBLY_ACC=CAM_ASM_000603 /LENGTH=168 /DNA_ID=CAMNT_0004734865 /DNA_START=631 /DNA_END=1134 /DNA_ORIENTATION=-
MGVNSHVMNSFDAVANFTSKIFTLLSKACKTSATEKTIDDSSANGQLLENFDCRDGIELEFLSSDSPTTDISHYSTNDLLLASTAPSEDKSKEIDFDAFGVSEEFPLSKDCARDDFDVREGFGAREEVGVREGFEAEEFGVREEFGVHEEFGVSEDLEEKKPSSSVGW